MLPMSARILLPGETLRAYINRIQMIIIDSTITAQGGNHTQAAKRLGYARSSFIVLKQRLRLNQLKESSANNDSAA